MAEKRQPSALSPLDARLHIQLFVEPELAFKGRAQADALLRSV